MAVYYLPPLGGVFNGKAVDMRILRGVILVVAAMAAVTVGCGAGVRAGEAGVDMDMVRVPLLEGVYSVEAPGNWRVTVSADDYTATFSEPDGKGGTLVIAPPNPEVDDLKDYTQLSVKALTKSFGGGQIMEEKRRTLDGIPAYYCIFMFKSNNEEFLGWAGTSKNSGYGVHAIAAASAEKYPAFMVTAGKILESYELDQDEVALHHDKLVELGRKSYEDLEKSLEK